MKIEQQISQFLDGELDSAQSANLIKQLRSDEQKLAWSRYHMASDAMRGELPDTLNHDLASRVSLALENEPTLFAPNAMKDFVDMPPVVNEEPAVEVETRAPQRLTAWGFGLAASLAMVGVLSLQSGGNDVGQPLATLANVPAVPQVIVAKQFESMAQIRQVAGVDKPVVVLGSSRLTAEQNPVPSGQWKRLDFNQHLSYTHGSNEFSVAPVANLGGNKAQ